MVAVIGRWSLFGGGHQLRFDCICGLVMLFKLEGQRTRGNVAKNVLQSPNIESLLSEHLSVIYAPNLKLNCISIR